VWRVEVGGGHSGPVTSGDRVIAFARQAEEEVVTCLDATNGKQLWHNDKVSAYRSSPVHHGKHLYLFAQERNGVLQCLTMVDGSVMWTGDDSLSRMTPT
jgi:outer membrane protein assembly factor BamB